MDLEERVRLLEEHVAKMHERNARVEADKAWEMSHMRVIMVGVLTYLVAVVFLLLIRDPNATFDAFVPVVGFVVSAQSLPFVKRWWQQQHHSAQE